MYVLHFANDDTFSAVLPTKRGANEKTYGIRNRRRNVYASLEVWMLWLGCLSITTLSTVPACSQLRDTRAAST